MADLMVQINDQTVPLKDCFWVRFNSNGCAEGSLLAVCPDEVFGTPEQAHRHFEPRQRGRDRDTRQGYTHELLTHEQWDRRAKPCLLGRCEHRATSEPAPEAA